MENLFKNQDYKEVYKKYYRNLPRISFYLCLSLLGLVGIADLLVSSKFLSDAYGGLLSFIVGTEPISSFVGALFVWIIIVAGVSFLVRILTTICVSQKIVVADSLMDLDEKYGSQKPVVADSSMNLNEDQNKN